MLEVFLSSDIFKVPVSQSPRPEGGIEDDNNNDRRDVILLFNSCQRRICFSVNLRAGVSRPNHGETFGIRIERTPDHGRTTILDENRTSGVVRIG